MKDGTITFEKRTESSMKLENTSSFEGVNLKNLRNNLLDLATDKTFKNLCKKGNQVEVIEYLVKIGILETKVSDNTNTESLDFIPQTNLAIVEVAVAITAVAIAVPTIIWAIREEEPTGKISTFYTNELNYCMDIISKCGNNKFSEEMYNVFSDLENGKEYTLVSRKNDYAK